MLLLNGTYIDFTQYLHRSEHRLMACGAPFWIADELLNNTVDVIIKATKQRSVQLPVGETHIDENIHRIRG